MESIAGCRDRAIPSPTFQLLLIASSYFLKKKHPSHSDHAAVSHQAPWFGGLDLDLHLDGRLNLNLGDACKDGGLDLDLDDRLDSHRQLQF
ncbi:hypothetical protein PR202_ga31202 [Eleusine coracana subsp. coracana]|uniref:Uncharacterized protein n=1 Tax=Eleusine coracana subsp. coracana TaxID=191504 RepID=A0AAV5DRK3_ELECO|nr:hypothetical protein PR202_ga31202 [Eleusine coracana subsp. coracana]